MSRFARERRVFYVEEPLLDSAHPYVEARSSGNLTIAVPHIPADATNEEVLAAQVACLHDLFQEHHIKDFVLWYYTPMALLFSRHLRAAATVYDCMDELSAFDDAPSDLQRAEIELFARAHVVFTGGQSLFEVKRHQHRNVCLFPSSVDVAHFARARGSLAEPAEQAAIPRPRLGFFGVVDERMDLDLLAGVADNRPDWHLVVIGPTVKIKESVLPRRQNIHYLGARQYDDLPSYVAGWDVALLPFARNQATRFISPTKTPEYLAAGRPVVSTSIRDVVHPYADEGLVRIADSPVDFTAAIAQALDDDVQAHRVRADRFLSSMSWDRTWSAMARHVDDAVASRWTYSADPAGVGAR